MLAKVTLCDVSIDAQKCIPDGYENYGTGSNYQVFTSPVSGNSPVAQIILNSDGTIKNPENLYLWTDGINQRFTVNPRNFAAGYINTKIVKSKNLKNIVYVQYSDRPDAENPVTIYYALIPTYLHGTPYIIDIYQSRAPFDPSLYLNVDGQYSPELTLDIPICQSTSEIITGTCKYKFTFPSNCIDDQFYICSYDRFVVIENIYNLYIIFKNKNDDSSSPSLRLGLQKRGNIYQAFIAGVNNENNGYLIKPSIIQATNDNPNTIVNVNYFYNGKDGRTPNPNIFYRILLSGINISSVYASYAPFDYWPNISTSFINKTVYKSNRKFNKSDSHYDKYKK